MARPHIRNPFPRAQSRCFVWIRYFILLLHVESRSFVWIRYFILLLVHSTCPWRVFAHSTTPQLWQPTFPPRQLH